MRSVRMPRMWLRCLTGTLVVMVAFCTFIYFTMFVHAPTEDILEANRKLSLSGKGLRDEDFYLYFDGEEPDPITLSQAKWDLWIKVHDHVDVGDVYINSCEPGPKRPTVGKVILLPDLEYGGLRTETHGNFTLDRTVTDGELFVEIFYNGKELFKNHFPLCTAEDLVPEKKILTCPIEEGKKRYVKNMKIPNFLPKGKYTTKTWITDQDDRMVGCGFCEFTL